MAKINEKKYKNVILFFANKIQNGTLGKLKLMKLLYFLDFDFFEKYGRSVTGDEYLRFEHGPVPRMGEKILNDIKGKGVRIISRKIGDGYNNQQLIQEYNIKQINRLPNSFFRDILILLSKRTINLLEVFKCH